MFFNTKHTAALCLASCMAFSSSAIADIVISGTRVVYKSEQKSVNVRLENKGNNPLLVQSWLDTGDDNAEPGSITVPFTATPPVSRIDAKRGQTIKLMYTASSALPKDRESVFWFNVLEVPPKPDAAKALLLLLLKVKRTLRPALRRKIYCNFISVHQTRIAKKPFCLSETTILVIASIWLK